jgi:hypothetical protein
MTISQGRARLGLTLVLALLMTVALSPTAFAQPRVEGSQIRNIEVEGVGDGFVTQFLGEGEEATFTGRIVNLTLERVGDEILASGRLIGQLTTEEGTQRINQAFQDIALQVLDGDGNVIEPNGNGNGVCPILFLELGPIFLDLLGLIVEVPDPIVVEIRAEEGPGRLLGNLLCALLGLLDDPVL